MCNDKEFKYFDESDAKSTVFSRNLQNFWGISENFDGRFCFPIKIVYFFLKATLEFVAGAGWVLSGFAQPSTSDNPLLWHTV